MGTDTLDLSKHMQRRYTQSSAVQHMLDGVAEISGSHLWKHLRAAHLVQIEKVDLAGSGIKHSAIAADRPTWVLTERSVDASTGTVGPVTEIIATSKQATHYQMHLLLRGWMSRMLYITDIGPGHCVCPSSETDRIWIRTDYIPSQRQKYLRMAAEDSDS